MQHISQILAPILGKIMSRQEKTESYKLGKWVKSVMPHSTFPHILLNCWVYLPGENDPLAHQYKSENKNGN